MKKITALLLAGAMALGLAACGSTNGKESAPDTSAKAGTTAESDDSAGAETYTITYNMNDGNTVDMQNYQFLGADFRGLINYDSRINITLTLELDGNGNYELSSDCFVIEAGKRQEVGGDSGLGQTWIMTAEGTYTDNGDGTITTSDATTAALTVATDTYSSQMKDSVKFSIAGSSEDGESTSADTPELLSYVPETIFTVKGDAIVSYENPNAAAAEEATETAEETEAVADAALVIPSDDQETEFKLYADGTYAFYFESYDITDEGTYTYADGVLTITDKNGTVTTSETDGDNVKFHYAYSDSDQLTGDYTVASSDLDAALN